MEADDSSSFESSETVGSFVASTPLLPEAWRLCSLANTAEPEGFVANPDSSVGYLAFSGVQMVAEGMDLGNLVPLEGAGQGHFTALRRHGVGDEEEGKVPVEVAAGVLRGFAAMHSRPAFQNQVQALLRNCRSLIVTGHSLGGAIASLTALWLLYYLQSASSSIQVLCITFGAPLVGNNSLSWAIRREQWCGNFIHVVSRHDVVPRLLFAPLPAPSSQPHCFLLRLWQTMMGRLHFIDRHAIQLPVSKREELFRSILAHTMVSAEAGPRKGSFWPFGNYYFCGEEGAICLDNGAAIVSMLHLTMATGTATTSIDDHFNYGECVQKISWQFLKRRTCEVPACSSYEAGLEIAVQSSGFASQDPNALLVKNCLKMAKPRGGTPDLNSANLAIALSKNAPYRAQIEWYKVSCDQSSDQLGYYDSFKRGVASKKRFKVNMNRIKLGQFWDEIIHMLGTNMLPHDFKKRAKWVNASQFYKLLVEPLEIAEYYRNRGNGGHYREHGREWRFVIFERWWKAREANGHHSNRSKFASFTQDSCFWARVEEAREWVASARGESDGRKVVELWASIEEFENYARRMVECKEVSQDVFAKNSSYSLWVEEWRELKSQKMQISPHTSSFLNGGMVP